MSTDNGFSRHVYTGTKINLCKEKLLDFEKVKSKKKVPITLREAAAFNSISESQCCTRCN